MTAHGEIECSLTDPKRPYALVQGRRPLPRYFGYSTPPVAGKCNALPKDAAFCENCGTPVRRADQVPGAYVDALRASACAGHRTVATPQTSRREAVGAPPPLADRLHARGCRGGTIRSCKAACRLGRGTRCEHGTPCAVEIAGPQHSAKESTDAKVICFYTT
jgi:hypothetical protein